MNIFKAWAEHFLRLSYVLHYFIKHEVCKTNIINSVMKDITAGGLGWSHWLTAVIKLRNVNHALSSRFQSAHLQWYQIAFKFYLFPWHFCQKKNVLRVMDTPYLHVIHDGVHIEPWRHIYSMTLETLVFLFVLCVCSVVFWFFFLCVALFLFFLIRLFFAI